MKEERMEYTTLPGQDPLGSAGLFGPGDREQRYRPYMENLRMEKQEHGTETKRERLSKAGD